MTDLSSRIMNIPCEVPDLERINAALAYRMGHRDARHTAAELADARITALEAEVARLRDVRQWDFYPIEMPITASGHGPATVGFDAASVTYEVWDRLHKSHASFDNLSDAFNDAMARNARALAQGEQPCL